MSAIKGRPARPTGVDGATWWQWASFSWAWPALEHGALGDLNTDHVMPLMGARDRALRLWQDMQGAQRKHRPESAKPRRWLRAALVDLHKFTLMQHAAWCLAESVVRVGSPVLLRRFLALLEQDSSQGGASADPSEVWMYASLLGLGGVLLCLMHHQTFWVGMRLGFHLRTQMLASIHAKVLRLNSKAISQITSGQVVNLVSNDVRRFDDGGPFWVFLWAGPLETLSVTILLWYELGAVPTLASMSALLALIPIQSHLGKYVGKVRRETAALTDQRVHVVSETISGIVATKMYAWEQPFLNIIGSMRGKEVASIARINTLRACNAAIWFISLPLVTYIAFATCNAQGDELTMSRISYVLALVQLPKLTLANFFVRGIETFSEMLVSIRRIEVFLNLPEPAFRNSQASFLEPGAGREADQAPVRVLLRGGSFEWEAASEGQSKRQGGGQPFVLRMPRGGVKQGELVGVTGAVGSGKSSLLSAILQEMVCVGGMGTEPVVVGTVAYAAQQPWIIAGTLRENVLFGLVMDKARYDAALHACALDEDVDALPAGDLTELGERGINLSGGQKARLALARAAYSQADVILLDDPLSAVDPPVGQHLFSECISGPLMASKAVILVTHQSHFLPRCDRVLQLEAHKPAMWVDPKTINHNINIPALNAAPNGESENQTLESSGRVSIEECLEQAYRASLDQARPLEDPDDNVSENPNVEVASKQHFNPLYSGAKSQNLQVPDALCEKKPKMEHSNTAAHTDGRKESPHDHAREGIITKEGKETGHVRLGVYVELCRNAGFLGTLVVAVLLVAGNGLQMGQVVWSARWATSDRQHRAVWIDTFTGLTAGVLVVGVARSLLLYSLCLGATRRIHHTMAARVLRAPLSFFHANPTGRILNRFSKDLGIADELLPHVLFDTLQCGGEVLATVLLTVVAVPLVTPVLAPLTYVFLEVRGFYTATSRDVKREEAMTRSPLFSSFSATLKGLATIRAYDAGARYNSLFLQQLDLNGAWWFTFMATARWFGFRLDLVSAGLLAAALALTVVVREFVSVGLIGISLAYVLQLSGLLQWFIRQTAETENNMTSVERLLEYTRLPQEAQRVQDGAAAPPLGWPCTGRLAFEDVHATYKPSLPPVLKGLTFHVAPGQLCGIAGRTGSGKSSLLLALYRMIDLTRGRVVLDGVDCASIGLDALRQSLAIIPQDPVLFSGSFRHNLDPFEQHTDDRLWEVLTWVQLKIAVSEMAGHTNIGSAPGATSSGLYAPMAECGDNLSAGQKQLVCLARAMLRKAKVFALDEATANVDTATDALIQKALRASLVEDKDSTALIIAHRLDTIIDCSTILVLAEGVAIEHGSPLELGSKKDGMFARLLKSAANARPMPTHLDE